MSGPLQWSKRSGPRHSPRSDSPDLYGGLLKQNFDHPEVVVIVLAGILGHAFGRNHHGDDAGLHDGAGAIHAGHDIDVGRAVFGRGAGAGGVADRVALGMLDPEVFGGAHEAFGHVVANATGKRIVAGGADFVVRSHDDAADLRIGVLAAAGDGFADVEVVLVPAGYGSHRVSASVAKPGRGRSPAGLVGMIR